MGIISNFVLVVVTWIYKFVKTWNYTLRMCTFYCIYLFLNKVDNLIGRTMKKSTSLKHSLTENQFWRKITIKHEREKEKMGVPGGAVVKSPPANAGDTGSSPGPGRSHTPRSNQARAPQLLSLRSRARAPQQKKPQQWEVRTPQKRVPPACLN